MIEAFRDWLRRIVALAPAVSRGDPRGDAGEPSARKTPPPTPGEGPWRFTDPLDRQWVLSTAPLESDPTLPGDRQLKALVCNCEDGWIFALPVGHDFRPEGLEREELCRLLVVAEGNAREISDWEPSRSEIRTVRDSETGREYEVQVVSRDDADQPRPMGAPVAQALVFRERGGSWISSTPLPAGTPMESLSPRDLLRFLQHALDLRPRLSLSDSQSRSEGSAARGGGASNLILVVEDEEDLRTIYRLALEKAGFEVIEAREGEQALSLVAQYGARLRAVVSDVVMPRVGGRELLWRLSEHEPGLPVILISGLLDRKQVTDGLEARPVSFLRKPFTPRELVDAVNTMLGDGPSGTLLPR